MVPRRTEWRSRSLIGARTGGLDQSIKGLLQLSETIDVASECRECHPRQYDGESLRRSSSPRSIVFEKREVRNVVSDKESGEKMLARDEESIIGQRSWCYLELER